MAAFIEVHPTGANTTIMVNLDDVRWIQPTGQSVMLYYRDGQSQALKDTYVMVKTLIGGATRNGIALHN